MIGSSLEEKNMGSRVTKECVRLRRELFQTLLQIFGDELGDASMENLPEVKDFSRHAGGCASCECLGRELGKAIWVKFDQRKIKG